MTASTLRRLVALLALAASACSPANEGPPWRVTDLCLDPPRVETGDGRVVAKRARVETIPLGPPDLRSLAAGEGEGNDDPSPLRPGLAVALRQPAKGRLVLPVSLGDRGYLEFRPLATPAAEATHRHRVSVRLEGRDEVLWEHDGIYSLWPPPELVSVDLARFAGRDVELVLELAGTGAPGQRFYWASPKVVSTVDPSPAAPRTEGRLNVLLVGADTLRADALGTYGARPSVTPALDDLADSSDVWLEAFSTFNITVPSFTSVLTGLYGKNHGVYENGSLLSDDAVTMAEMLYEAGYATAAFLAAGHLFNANLGQGFDHVEKPPGHLAGEAPVDAAMSWLQQNGLRESGQPFFVWVHLYDTHTPHTPPGRFSRGLRPAKPYGLAPVREWVQFGQPGPPFFQDDAVFAQPELYRGAVAYMDRQIDRLLGFMRSNGLLDDTIVVFLADHGELIDEHGSSFRHVGFWDAVVRVPLIVRWPGRRDGRRLSGLVQTIDVLPTVLAALGLPVPPMDGRRLLDSPGPKRDMAFAEYSNQAGAMIRTAGHKYFNSRFDYAFPAGDYLYDVVGDPDEANNAASARPDVTDRLRDALAEWLTISTGTRAEKQQLSHEEIEELKALGYLN